MKEQELIKSAIKQNRSAQTALYRKYKSGWFMICLRYNRNRFDAEDCLQTALMSIFSNLHQFDPDKGAFKHWSDRIVVNACLRFLQRQDRFQYSDSMEDYLPVLPEQNVEGRPVSTEYLLALVQKLPAGYRSIFNLYVLEGYNHQEIAQIMSISVGTSKSQLAKAKRMLRNQLEAELKAAS